MPNTKYTMGPVSQAAIRQERLNGKRCQGKILEVRFKDLIQLVKPNWNIKILEKEQNILVQVNISQGYKNYCPDMRENSLETKPWSFFNKEIPVKIISTTKGIPDEVTSFGLMVSYDVHIDIV